jgi:hypothetical protein
MKQNTRCHDVDMVEDHDQARVDQLRWDHNLVQMVEMLKVWTVEASAVILKHQSLKQKAAS